MRARVKGNIRSERLQQWKILKSKSFRSSCDHQKDDESNDVTICWCHQHRRSPGSNSCGCLMLFWRRVTDWRHGVRMMTTTDIIYNWLMLWCRTLQLYVCQRHCSTQQGTGHAGDWWQRTYIATRRAVAVLVTRGWPVWCPTWSLTASVNAWQRTHTDTQYSNVVNVSQSCPRRSSTSLTDHPVLTGIRSALELTRCGTAGRVTNIATVISVAWQQHRRRTCAIHGWL